MDIRILKQALQKIQLPQLQTSLKPIISALVTLFSQAAQGAPSPQFQNQVQSQRDLFNEQTHQIPIGALSYMEVEIIESLNLHNVVFNSRTDYLNNFISANFGNPNQIVTQLQTIAQSLTWATQCLNSLSQFRKLESESQLAIRNSGKYELEVIWALEPNNATPEKFQELSKDLKIIVNGLSRLIGENDTDIIISQIELGSFRLRTFLKPQFIAIILTIVASIMTIKKESLEIRRLQAELSKKRSSKKEAKQKADVAINEMSQYNIKDESKTIIINILKEKGISENDENYGEALNGATKATEKLFELIDDGTIFDSADKSEIPEKTPEQLGVTEEYENVKKIEKSIKQITESEGDTERENTK